MITSSKDLARDHQRSVTAVKPRNYAAVFILSYRRPRSTLCVRLWPCWLRCLVVLMFLVSASTLSTEEQTLFRFAQKLVNFKVTPQNLTSSSNPRLRLVCCRKDAYSVLPKQPHIELNNTIKRATQVWPVYRQLCLAPTGKDGAKTPTVSVPDRIGWGLQGAVSAAQLLTPLDYLQTLNLSDNSLSGTLPPTLPKSFRQQRHAPAALNILDLSKNRISGSIPALWGDDSQGWGPGLQSLHLEDNKLTGQLPQLWSDSNSLWQLAVLDLSNNQLTGSITLDQEKLAGIGYHNSITSEVLQEVENLEIFYNVTSFSAECPTVFVGTKQHGILQPLVTGIALLTVMGLLLALVACIRRQEKSNKASQPNADDAGLVVNCIANVELAAVPEASDRFDMQLRSTHVFEPLELYASSEASSKKRSTGCSSSSSYYTPKALTADEVKPLMWQTLQPSLQMHLVPGPLWDAVQIPANQLSLAQTAAGQNWVLGQGSYGMVYKGCMQDVHEVAIKVLKSLTSPRDLALLQTEIAALRSCNNKNIVRFHGVSFKDPDVWLIMELLEGGTLYQALAHSQLPITVTWYHRGGQMALDVAKGLHFLHSHRIMHLDLKSPNILLAADGTAKIADVGLSRMFTLRPLRIDQNVGTFHWMAPELISAGKCTEKADIFSFGVVLHEIVTAQQPRRGCLVPIRVPDHCPQVISHLIASCLTVDPQSRPSAAEIVRVISQCPPAEHG